MRFFPPAIRTPVWEARMRSLERRRHEVGPLYQVANYLAALDQLFDEQAHLLREQTHRAEQAELAVRLQQVRAAQAEARAAAAISSEAVAQESLRHARDRRMQEWTRSGTPVPAIGEDHVLLGTPIIGWGTLFESPQAPPRTLAGLPPPPQEKPLRSPWRTGTRRTASRLFPPKKSRLASRLTDATLVLYPASLSV